MEIRQIVRDNMADVYCCLGEKRDQYKDETTESVGYMKENPGLGWLIYGAYNDENQPVGMAILIPSTDPVSSVIGKDVYYFHCMDINKELRKQGLGTKLIERITDDVKALGAKGLAVDCWSEYWMPLEFFKKRGFELVQAFHEHSLLLKKISSEAVVRFHPLPYWGDLPQAGLQVDIQHWVTCPYIISNYRKAKEIIAKLEPDAVIRERIIDTAVDVGRWGGSGLFINGLSVSGGPVSEEGLKKAFAAAKDDLKTRGIKK